MFFVRPTAQRQFSTLVEKKENCTLEMQIEGYWLNFLLWPFGIGHGLSPVAELDIEKTNSLWLYLLADVGRLPISRVLSLTGSETLTAVGNCC